MEGKSTGVKPLETRRTNVIEITGLHWHSHHWPTALSQPLRQQARDWDIFLENAFILLFPFSLFYKTMQLLCSQLFILVILGLITWRVTCDWYKLLVSIVFNDFFTYRILLNFCLFTFWYKTQDSYCIFNGLPTKEGTFYPVSLRVRSPDDLLGPAQFWLSSSLIMPACTVGWSPSIFRWRLQSTYQLRRTPFSIPDKIPLYDSQLACHQLISKKEHG